MLAVALLVMTGCAPATQDAIGDDMEWTLDSPHGQLSVSITYGQGPPEGDEYGVLRYQVTRDGSAVVGGAMGVVLDDDDLAESLTFVSESREQVQASFDLPHGKARQGEASAQEMTLSFTGPRATPLAVVVRAFDDGIAYRYIVGEPGDEQQRTVTDEATTVVFGNGKAWIQKTDIAGNYTPAYESLYSDGIPIGQGAPVPSWNLPALFEVEDSWVLVAESDVDSTYFAGHIEPVVGTTTYQWRLPQGREGMAVGNPQPSHSGRWEMPWRVLVVGELSDVVETNLVRLLASDGHSNADWIRPGKVSWSWWSDHDSPQNLESLRDYVDFGVEAGWEHTLIDANWNLNDEAEMRELIDYANEQGVGVFLWYNSGGPNNRVTEQPRDRMYESEVRRAELSQLAEWGVAGIKVDFWHSDKQESIGRYLNLTADAYEAGLMVNYHGSTIPRGWEVRFPNLMTMEGVRGAEQYSFDPDFPQAAPGLNTILPFTRNAVGSMDYTPVTFSDNVYAHITTNAHELALAVVFESALQHFADSAASYRSQPQHVKDYLRDVPAFWDETRLLDGYPGEFVVIARRLGEAWWISGINGGEEDRTVTLGLDFVGADQMRLLGDAGVRQIGVDEVDTTGALTITMVPFGGFALEPIE